MAGKSVGFEAAKRASKKSLKKAVRRQEKSARRETSRVISRKVVRKASSAEPKVFEARNSGSSTTYDPVASSSQTTTANVVKYGWLGVSAALIIPKIVKYFSDKMKGIIGN